MGFWKTIDQLKMPDFKPGVHSLATLGDQVVMVCMEIDAQQEDTGHRHPVEQCGIVIAGKIEIVVENERHLLHAMDTYFIPAGVLHGWKTFDVPARILDVMAKQSA